jgi:membrane-bound lytic murein transglycosylase D
VEPPPAPKPDPVAKVLGESEAAYQAGVEAYKTGHSEAARRDFDRAVDLLLMTPAEIRQDGRIEAQFEKLVDEIHRYETVALREGDGFSERHEVPALMDEIAELTFPSPPDPKLKETVERAVKGTVSDLPLMINDYVLSYVNYFTSKGRASMETALRRAGQYREMISRILAEQGVPQDLIYLAQAESAFQPWAVSRAGARGIWQFMASSGRNYDLRVDYWVDERQDPEKATHAAARHLKDLHDSLGDWYLAMAAYNSGIGGVQKAVEKTGYADFWELYRLNALPRETRNYVPIILAATIVGKNPEKYGLDRIIADPAIATEEVVVSIPTDLRLIAETIDVSLDLILTLNPSLLQRTTPRGEFHLQLPAGTKERFLEQIALIPEDKRVLWRWHQVQEGEGLEQIARRYGTTPKAIGEVNGLASEELQAGARLVIPATVARQDGGKTRTVLLRYRVKRGDTVARVADRFGVSPSQVRSWNRIRGNTLTPGQTLVIHTAFNAPPSSNAAPPSSSAARKKAASASKAKKTKSLSADKATQRPPGLAPGGF